jgi:Effector-associated domain 1
MDVKINAKKIGQQIVGENVTIQDGVTRTTPSNEAVGPWTLVSGQHAPQVGNELIDELAKVFNTLERANVILERVDFPRGLRPSFSISLSFWTTVLEEIRNGAAPGNIDSLTAAAADLYASNAVFRRLRT